MSSSNSSTMAARRDILGDSVGGRWQMAKRISIRMLDDVGGVGGSSAKIDLGSDVEFPRGVLT